MAANMENLPEHILLDILSLVPASDLIYNCRLVCSQWRDLVDLPVLWKRKFQKRDHDSSPKPLAFYIFSRLKKNLIKNPDGQDGLDSWEIQTPAEGHWETEELSIEDSKSVRQMLSPYKMGYFWENDEDAPVQLYKCFASRNRPCSKSQLITLKDEGYWDELMDEARPTMEVKDCFSSGYDSCYTLTVKLLSADSEVLKEHQYKEPCVSTWYPVSHTIYDCPQGVRHILFEHKVHPKACPPDLLKYLFPEQGPSEDREPPWGEMRVLQSSITLHPPLVAEEVDDDYYDYHYRDYPDSSEHSSGDELPYGFFYSASGFDSWYNYD
ncbi:F-box only protein 44-like [Podarcis lilfordi]|uniref:F-box only protein 44-like n=1 Tax=Podarcis lilfordi TaxID=74358 RepID=A0AA35PEL3_9SAUR|nr:F-box only protein 44-like [Podarcis lilfordi]